MVSLYRILSVTLDYDVFVKNKDYFITETDMIIKQLCESDGLMNVHNFAGDYHLYMNIADSKLIIDICDAPRINKVTHIFSLNPFLGIFEEYREIKNAYKHALSGDTSLQLETIDMARRGVHNQAADMLIERFARKMTIDFETARHFFSIFVLLLESRML